MVLLLLGCVLAMTTGAMHINALDTVLAIGYKFLGQPIEALNTIQQSVVFELRLPRVVLAMAVGATLSVCGATLQALFRNPLADPGIIGVSSGAAVGAISAIVLLPGIFSGYGVPVFAFLGGLSTTLIVYRLARSDTGGTSVVVLLLAGVAVSAFAGAIIGYLSYFADDESLRTLSLWQMGSLAKGGSEGVWLGLGLAIVLVWFLTFKAPLLNAFLLGEPEARHLGFNVEREKLGLIVVCALAVGVAVAFTGIIGFVGLVVPHFVRMLVGPNHQFVVPLSGLGGAVLLVLSDVLARLLVRPAELPVGLISALCGAPLFLVLLLQVKRRL
jgi:iron complex transport system permease protein